MSIHQQCHAWRVLGLLIYKRPFVDERRGRLRPPGRHRACKLPRLRHINGSHPPREFIPLLASRAPATRSTFREDVWRGLAASSKWLLCKYLYDREGSRLFERITQLREYYPTRCELEILLTHGDEIAARVGPYCTLLAPGCGSGRKLRPLLEALDHPVAVVPIDLATSALDRAVTALSKQRPEVRVVPVVADFTEAFCLPRIPEGERRLLFLGGSTIGNFSELEAVELLRRFGRLVGPRGGILAGVDLPKDRITLERAYDDEEGVTAEFNLNLLRRINRELDGDFRIHQFTHLARWRPERLRVEMHLVSTVPQRATVAGRAFEFARWETIHTENSHKYSIPAFRALAHHAGLNLAHTWTDERGLYSVQYLVMA